MRRSIVSAVAVLCVCAPAIAARAWDAPVFTLRPGWRLIQPAVRSGAWAVAVAADAPAPPDLPHSLLLIAHQEGGVWRVRSGDASNAVDAAAFDAWLDALPHELLPAQDRAWFRSGDRARGAHTATAAGFRLPVPGGWTALMTQGPFGPYSHNTYWAVDLVLPYWEPYTSMVVATKAGVVMYVKDVSDVGGLGFGYSGYANGVVIRHGPGEYSWYWHLAHDSVPADVQPGAPIEAGAAIGRMGSTGYSSGAHLHFHVTESFAWEGCDSERGCSAREMRLHRAPWSWDMLRVDFEEVLNEAAWHGCDSVAQCGQLPRSANRLDATGGAVLYWAQEYDGPAWKARASYAGDVPGWLAGRAQSMALPTGWEATLYDRPGLQGTAFVLRESRVAFDASPWSLYVREQLPTPVPPPTATPVPVMGRRVTKLLRSDLAADWTYLLGGEQVAAVEVDGHLAMPGACSWVLRSLSPGPHALTFTLRSDAVAAAEVEARRWPFASPSCMQPPADPGPMPVNFPCVDGVDEHEPNSGAWEAQPLRSGEAHQHRTAWPGDEDWSVITMTHGSSYVIETDALGDAADTVLEVFDRSVSSVLARSDDAGDGRASRVALSAHAGDAWYVRVKQWDPGASGCGTNYVLRLIETKPRSWAPAIL